MTYVGLFGAGKMAQALAKGIIKSGFVSPDRLIASALINDKHHLDTIASLGCRTTLINEDVAKCSDVLILAVKPNVVGRVLNDISHLVCDKQLLVSVASGIPINTIEQAVPAKTRVVRVMPNTPSLVMQGATVFAKGTSATHEDGLLVRRLFTSVGLCEEVPENCMDAVTGLSGSGPAYIYMIIEALADGGVKMGLGRELAVKLSAQCVLGAAKMVLDEKKHPGALKDDVTSPGGCTIHALHLLEQAGLRAIFMSAVEEATKRAKQMAYAENK